MADHTAQLFAPGPLHSGLQRGGQISEYHRTQARNGSKNRRLNINSFEPKSV